MKPANHVIDANLQRNPRFWPAMEAQARREGVDLEFGRSRHHGRSVN